MDTTKLHEPPGQNDPNSQSGVSEAEAPPRTRNIVFNLFLFASIVLLLLLLKQVQTGLRSPTAPSPVDFSVIEERYDKVPLWVSQKKVEALLGPPTDRRAYEEEFSKLEDFAIHSMRLRDSTERFWQKWVDPNNPERWVAIFYAGYYPDYTAYAKTKRGF